MSFNAPGNRYITKPPHPTKVSRIYITSTGLYDWPVVNGLWASIVHRNYIPDKLYLLSILGGNKREARLSRWLKAVLRGYGSSAQVEVTPLSVYGFTPTIEAIREIVERERGNKSDIAVDITPARKAIVAGILISGCSIAFDHVFYLYIENLRYANHPYLMIPLCMQKHQDFMEEAENVL